MRERGAVLGVAVLAVVWGLVLSWGTPVPKEDGVNLLWMAERFAAGDFAAPMGEVFPPLTSLLVAVPVALGVEPFVAGQGVLSLCAGAAVIAVAAVTRALGHGRVLVAAALTAGLPLLARHAAEIYVGPLFVVLSGGALAEGLRDRPGRAGVWAAAAFWVRPEALALPLGLLWARRRAAFPVLPPVLVGVAVLTVWRGLAGHGWNPLPELAFNLERGLAETRDPLGNLLHLPGRALEAFGLVLPLALVGAWGAAGPGRRTLSCVLGVAVVPIVAFAVRRRFLARWSAAVVPLAASGVRRLPARARLPAVAITVLTGLAIAWQGRIDADRIAERELGRWLAARLAPDETVAGDMTRVQYFAGRRPLPPRHLTVAEIVARAREPDVRYLVLGHRRPTFGPVRASLGARFRAVSLPQDLARLAADRGVTVLAK